ncbi:late competence development ComFB family protein [Caldimonas sp. KR1-144]|uniref:late competence development ComFB family protein n=1 Tax=Caldimonas sp. KR1-144 TaxID=3400911 RepID=UPI003BFDC87D
MSADFSSIHNHQERLVFAAVSALAPQYGQMRPELLPDVACVALNRLPPRYIRHMADLAFYQSGTERDRSQKELDAAVRYAFEFVQAREAMHARS